MEKNFKFYDMVSAIDGTIIGHPDRNVIFIFFLVYLYADH